METSKVYKLLLVNFVKAVNFRSLGGFLLLGYWFSLIARGVRNHTDDSLVIILTHKKDCLLSKVKVLVSILTLLNEDILNQLLQICVVGNCSFTRVQDVQAIATKHECVRIN